MWQLIDSGLRHGFRSHRAVQERLADLTHAVEKGEVTPFAAAQALLELLKR
jgi:hypothetical protein